MEDMIKEYLKEHLRIEKKEVSSSYGSRPYIIIMLKLDDEVISETYIDQ